MKEKIVSYKLKGETKKIKNIVYDNRKEATATKLYLLAQRVLKKIKKV